jgi:hypothetical protein
VPRCAAVQNRRSGATTLSAGCEDTENKQKSQNRKSVLQKGKIILVFVVVRYNCFPVDYVWLGPHFSPFSSLFRACRRRLLL